MKVLILAGGFGTRLSEETVIKPKPMVEIGEMPILWHIMKYYTAFSFNEFVLALGYKAEIIKTYFLNYSQISGDMYLDLKKQNISKPKVFLEDWKIHLIETGLNTMTGGRIKRLKNIIGNQRFLLTYGDGLSNIDLNKLISFHKSQKSIVTISAVRPPARFGGIEFEGDKIKSFVEKNQIQEGWINGGFMVVEPEIFDFLKSDDDILEVDVLEKVAKEKKLSAYKHHGFWQCMDALRDKHLLESLWKEKKADWKIWE